MDYGYIGKLFLSVMIFAPGLIVFVAACVVGVVALVEGKQKMR